MKLIVFVTLSVLSALSLAHPLANTRLVMEGASCAGLEFIGSERMRLYDEMTCSRSGSATLSARVSVLSKSALLAIEEAGPDGPMGRPPCTWVFRIDALSQERATLTEVWTGWGDLPDDRVDYRVRSPNQARGEPLYRIESVVAGDIACYITFVDEQQVRHEGMAEFSLCERPLVGRDVRFFYRQARVAAASCEGDPECPDYDSIALIVDAQPVR